MQVEFAVISREHPEAMERVFEDVEDHVHILPV